MNSLIIRNGMVVDTENGRVEKKDIAAMDGKIAEIADRITGDAVSEVDASGCYVTPGLIDHHTHIYPMAKIGIPAESVCFGAGVTTAVDAGSTGCRTFEKHLPYLDSLKLDVKAYLHVCSTGLDSLPDTMEDVRPEHMEYEAIRDMFEKHGDRLLGLKLRTSKNIVGEQGLEPLKATVALGERLGVPVMVHITNPPASIDEILRILRPGDIVTHMYQNTGYHLLRDGKVMEEAWKARERGILFEAADARAHFSFAVSETAIREGFIPDLLGTDVTKLSMHLRPTAFNMAMQISKYTFLGMEFADVIRRSTWNNAVSMGISDRVGSLREGKQADIAVFRPCEKKNVFGDRPDSSKEQEVREGNLVYEPVLTVKNGEMVYRNITF